LALAGGQCRGSEALFFPSPLAFSVQLYSTKSFQPLGTLVYHKDNCHAVAFASSYERRASDDHPSTGPGEGENEDDDMTDEEKRQRGRWLFAAGKDYRVSIWGLISFDNAGTV
jgi:ASTRA-associated protein 1